jgi:hypothetical protein
LDWRRRTHLSTVHRQYTVGLGMASSTGARL